MMLSKYGPGKFSYNVDVIAHDYTMMGAQDEETGDVESSGWFGLILGPLDPAGLDGEANLTPDDREFLATRKGCIVSEDSNGFVYVDWFDNEQDVRAEWERIVERVSEFLEE